MDKRLSLPSLARSFNEHAFVVDAPHDAIEDERDLLSIFFMQMRLYFLCDFCCVSQKIETFKV